MYEQSAVVWIGDRGYRMVFSEFSEVVNGEYMGAWVDHDTATIHVSAEHCTVIKNVIAYAKQTKAEMVPAKRRRKKAA
jgi:hypothetical protein